MWASYSVLWQAFSWVMYGRLVAAESHDQQSVCARSTCVTDVLGSDGVFGSCWIV